MFEILTTSVNLCCIHEISQSECSMTRYKNATDAPSVTSCRYNRVPVTELRAPAVDRTKEGTLPERSTASGHGLTVAVFAGFHEFQ